MSFLKPEKLTGPMSFLILFLFSYSCKALTLGLFDEMFRLWKLFTEQWETVLSLLRIDNMEDGHK
jgi:hypothetical protein